MINQQKNEIRKQIKFLKSRISSDEKKVRSELIFNELETLKEFINSNVILLFWSISDEVFTHDFIQKWAVSKKIILPSIKGDELELKRFTGVKDLVKGASFGIGEPSGKVWNNLEEIDLIIVPGIAFDKNKNRLGRGKAYYDKLLKSTTALKIGVCFDFQFMESVPTDTHDVKMDFVITDN